MTTSSLSPIRTSTSWYIKTPFHYPGRRTYSGKPTKKYIQYIRDNYDKLKYVPLLPKDIWEAAFPDRPFPRLTVDKRSMPTWGKD